MGMLAYAHNGTLTGLTPEGDATVRIRVSRARVSKTHALFDTTGPANERDANYTHSKRRVLRLEGQGWYQKNATSWDFVHITDNLASISGSILARVNQIILVKEA